MICRSCAGEGGAFDEASERAVYVWVPCEWCLGSRVDPESDDVVSAAARAVTVRDVGVDALRGAAILLMVLDHVLHVVDPDSVLRTGSPVAVTRLSLPLFMLAAAAVWRPLTWRRYGRLTLVGMVESVLYVVLGMGGPGIVALVVGVLLLVDVVGVSWLVGVLGLVQARYASIGWFEGYQPGMVLLWFVLGRLAWQAGAVSCPWWLRWPVLAWVGRHPIWWYVGHLLVLVAVVVVV